MAAPLWQKGTAAADWVMRFTVGDDYLWDRLLLPYDARATGAHARGLVAAGVLTADELARLDEALAAFMADAEAGRITIRPEDEDAHTVLETYLVARLGDVGKKIHTGRSRNDQVLAALRLCLKDRLAALGRATAALAEALCTLAEAHPGLVMPGYTHFQQAMPTTVALWALGYAELLADDLGVLRAARDTLDASPLGSAAGYGVPGLDLPRAETARDLGFARVQTHVTAVQLARGKFELGAAHACVQVAATLNRLAADLVLFASAEFGFVRLAEAFTTGSSIMPQKRNPDVAELARAAFHRVAAEMHLLVTLPANLPSGYHRDLQLTKEAVLRATSVTADVLAAMHALVPGLTWDRARLAAALTPELFATAHALDLVRAGTPFRDAYRQAAADVPTLAVPTPEAALAAYRVDGMPGRERPDLVRAALSEAAAWTENPGR